MVAACVKAEVQFSLVLTKNAAVNRAIAAIPADAWTPVRYPGAVADPDTGEFTSDAEVAQVPFTAFASTRTPVTARLVVRRVRDANHQDPLFPVWRHHPFFTNSSEDTVTADLTHRKHAIIETVFADLIDGPLAHLPSGLFASNAAWTVCAMMTHNLLRAAGTLASPTHARVRGATLRRHLIHVPARLARPQRRALIHLPPTGPGNSHGKPSGTECCLSPHPGRHNRQPPATGPTERPRRSWQTSRTYTSPIRQRQPAAREDHPGKPPQPLHGSRLNPNLQKMQVHIHRKDT